MIIIKMFKKEIIVYKTISESEVLKSYYYLDGEYKHKKVINVFTNKIHGRYVFTMKEFFDRKINIEGYMEMQEEDYSSINDSLKREFYKETIKSMQMCKCRGYPSNFQK